MQRMHIFQKPLGRHIGHVERIENEREWKAYSDFNPAGYDVYRGPLKNCRVVLENWARP